MPGTALIRAFFAAAPNSLSPPVVSWSVRAMAPSRPALRDCWSLGAGAPLVVVV